VIMFSYSDCMFVADSTSIVVSSIELKLNEEFFVELKSVAVEFISKYIDAIIGFEASGERDSYCSEDNEAERVIRFHHCDLTSEIKDEDVLQVFEALRYTFSCYAYNGLHQLYTRQENECWHPKVLLARVLTPNDIDSLDLMLTLYRGCDIGELETGVYGQAWSTSLDVATAFAYTHYQNQDWFYVERRVVLEMNCARENVFFSDQSVEYEVVVDVARLGSVLRIS